MYNLPTAGVERREHHRSGVLPAEGARSARALRGGVAGGGGRAARRGVGRRLRLAPLPAQRLLRAHVERLYVWPLVTLTNILAEI